MKKTFKGGSFDNISNLQNTIMVLFEIHQRFKGHFLNELRVSFKVTRVVDLKLVFTEWFFYDSIILIKLYKIRYLNLDKAPLFPRNLVICLKNWKLWRAPTTVKFNIFSWNFADISYLTMSTKGCSGKGVLLF